MIFLMPLKRALNRDLMRDLRPLIAALIRVLMSLIPALMIDLMLLMPSLSALMLARMTTLIHPAVRTNMSPPILRGAGMLRASAKGGRTTQHRNSLRIGYLWTSTII